MNDLGQSCMEMSEVPSQPREVNHAGISVIPTCGHRAPGAVSTAPPQPHLLDLTRPGLPSGERQDMEIRDLGIKALF